MSGAVVIAAEVFLAVLCAVLGYSVITRRLVMAWPIHIGVALFTLAALGGLDAILSDRPFLDMYSVAARWLLVGLGVAFIAGCFAWRIFRPHHGRPQRRVTDFIALSGPAPLDGPRAKPRRRWPWRWRR